MGVLRCTRRYRKTLGIPHDLEEPGRPENALGDWSANTLNVGRQRFLHYLSEKGRLSVIITLRQRRDAEARFLRQLRELLLFLGVSEDLVDREVAATSPLTFALARDRSVLGSMNDHGFNAWHDLQGGRRSLLDVMRRLAVMPAGPLAMKSADRVVPTLVRSHWSGPPPID